MRKSSNDYSCAVFGAHADSRMSHREQALTELSFAFCWTWTKKYKSQFKHANRKKMWKSPIQQPHVVSWQIHNYVKIPVLEIILEMS